MHVWIAGSGGWDRFEMQKKYTVGGFYCGWPVFFSCPARTKRAPDTASVVCPEMIKLLIKRAGLEVAKESAGEESTNTYLNRDYLVVVQKAAASVKKEEVEEV